MRGLERFSAFLASYALLGGLLSLAGWLAGEERLLDWFGTGIHIKANAAIAAACAGAALLVTVLWPRARRLALVLAGVTAALGGATLVEHLTNYDIGIDTLLFPEPPGAPATASPGRMGPPASTSFLLLGTALALLAGGAPARAAASRLALVALGISVLSLVGYLYGAAFMYSAPRLTGIAAQTASIILALALGTIVAVPEHEPMSRLCEPGVAGALARRALPVVVLGPVVLGWLCLAGERMGFYDSAFGAGLLTLTLVALLSGLLWQSLSLLSAHAAALRDSEQLVTAELSDMRRLHDVSTSFVAGGDAGSLHHRIVDAAAGILHADCGSLHVLDAERHEARLLAHRALAPEAAAFLARVDVSSASACSTALRTRERVVVADVTVEAALAGSHDLRAYLGGGIRAVQSTPLLSRGGRLLGILSTHWRRPHQPADRELRLLDILARQAADLLERAHAEEALRVRDRRKDEFLAMLGHELRNPLGAITSAAHLLDAASPAAHATARAIIARQAAQLTRLVDDLLDVSRVTRGALAMKKASVSLQEVVASAAEMVRPLVAEQRHELAVALPDEPIPLLVDPARMTQVLGNLLNNAARYTPPGGHLALTAAVEGGDVVVRVQDDGVGMAPELLSRVFEMFVQGPAPAHRAGGGLGIGLALARRLVEANDGSIEARSAGPGKGSEFVVRLPLAESAAEAEPAVLAPVPDVPGCLRILVADDNADSAEALAMLFKQRGHTVRTAHDGRRALAEARAFRPNIAFVDIGMPELNGYDVARGIRSEPAAEQPILVALSGWGQEADRRRSKAAGFDSHLTKPADYGAIEVLLASLRPGGRPAA
jgi:signal transduction histidine kinase/CheY-like chemotaxis protein